VALGVAVADLTVGACGVRDRVPAGELARLRPPILVGSAAVAAPSGGTRRVTDAVSRVARQYYQALDNLRHGMRAAPLARLLAPGCPCRAQVRAVRAAARHGERYTDRVRLLTLVAHVDGPDLADAVVSLDIDHAGLVDAAGHRIGVATTLHGVHRELMLRLSGGRWLIERVIAV
jgi:hypothetical protein